MALTLNGDGRISGANLNIDSDGAATFAGLTVDTNTLHVDAVNNNVGIGTTSPAAFSGYTTLGINNTTNGGILDLMQNGSMKMRLIGLSGSGVIETASSLPIQFAPAGTERMRIDASGRVTMPYQPMFTARGYSSLSGGFQLYDVVDFDIGNNFNNTNGRFTAPIAGTYFAAFGSGYKAADNYLGYGLNKNGTQLYLSWSGNQTNERHQFNGGSFLVSMSASDYLQVSVSSGYTIPDDSTIYTYFSVYLVG